MYYRKWMDRMMIIDADWPFSLGWKIGFVTCNKHFGLAPNTMTSSKLNKATNRDGVDDGGDHGFSALAATWEKNRTALITVFYKGDNMIRFNELIAHEASHIVDGILKRCYIKKIDTEVRAYLLDWIVGRILRVTKLKYPNKKLLSKITPIKDKKKKNKKKNKKKSKKNGNSNYNKGVLSCRKI